MKICHSPTLHMAEGDYKELLKKVQSEASSRQIDEERFKIPKVEIFYEGNTTVLKNFDKILSTINRKADHLLKFLLDNVGTAGELVGNRAVFQGKIPPKTVQDKVVEYIDIYVLCSECNRPDTHLVKKDRMILVRCDACGAFRAVGSRKKMRIAAPSETLKEGNTYDVTIKDIGKRGDGVAYVDKYVLYIPGAVKGSSVKVKIEKISGTVAFGRLVE